MEKENEAMTNPVVFHGICSNCIHARTCRYALNALRPVQFCDLHEVRDEPGRFKGLCVDCIKRHQCDLAGTESGVWRCEDYRSEPRSDR